MTNVAPALPATSLHTVVRRLRARQRRGVVLGALLRTLLALALPSIALIWLRPAWAAATISFGLGVAAIAVTMALWRGRREARALLQNLDQDLVDGRVLGELDDELRTWLDHERDPRGTAAMRQWLSVDVTARLAALPAGTLQPLGRPRLGRWLNLLPLVLLLLLAWLLSWWLAPPWNGALGGAADGGSSSSNGDGQGHGGGKNDAPPTPADQKPPPSPDGAPPPPAPPPPPPTAEPEPPSEQPSPLLNLPEQQRFVLPEFIDDGPTRRARMRAAEVETGGAQQNASRGGEGAEAATPPPTKEQFEHAAEAALRARHVPPAEQPMVRRFFDALREAGK